MSVEHNLRGKPILDAYARELTDVCRKYGIGITGSPSLFEMESIEDYSLRWCVDERGNLAIG